MIFKSNSFVNLFSMWMSESDLETEPTEPGPLGKETSDKRRTDNQLFSLNGELILPCV